MEIVAGQVPDEFWTTLARARKRVLFLDYDGTLAPFQIERDKAVPYPGVMEFLARIVLSGTRVVIISGRSISEVISLINLKPIPEIWGSHGLERLLTGGTLEKTQLSNVIQAGLEEAASVAKHWLPSERIEFKHGCLALHWRGMSEGEIEGIVENVEPAWRILAESSDLNLHRFDGGIELRAPGRDKGTAVKKVLEETDVGLVAAYLGDDLTDEDGFRVVNEKNGLSILVRSEFRETSARIWLRPPEELLAFFATWLRNGERETGGA